MSELSDLGLDLFKDLVWDSLVGAAVAKLLAAYPVIFWGPIGAFVSWIIPKFADLLYSGASELVDLSRVVIKNPRLKKKFEREDVRLKVLARQNGVHSDEFKTQREQAKKDFSMFVRYDAAR